MLLIAGFLGCSCAGQSLPIEAPKPQPPRFVSAQPLAALPAIQIDRRQDGVNESDRLARQLRAQARILWIDATANLVRTNSEEKIVTLVRRVADSGFNTIVFDVKPISGQVIYPSRISPQITEWRGQTFPAGFDPLPILGRECKRTGIHLLASLNAFSEGHSMFKVGPGYAQAPWQTVLLQPKPQIRIEGGERMGCHWEPGAAPLDGVLSVIPEGTAWPRIPAGSFAVTVRGDGSIVDGFENPSVHRVTAPKDGLVIVGTGGGATFLRVNALPWKRLRFEMEHARIPISQDPTPQIPLISNPASPAVWSRNFEFLRELGEKKVFDGFVYDDRLRFAGDDADFSPEFLAAFERWLGHSLASTDEIFKYTVSQKFERGIAPGPLYENWLIFRAAVMKSYVKACRVTLDGIDPKLKLGLYVGSWYGEYAKFGTNYAGEGFQSGFWHHSPAFAQTGLAGELDFLIAGCYYRTPTIMDAFKVGAAIGPTVESSARLATRVADDQTWTYAGLALSQFKGNPSGFGNALQAACASSQGVMIFDLSHDIEPFWPLFKRAFLGSPKPPHLDRKNLGELRRRRKLGGPKPPVIISAGAAGTGH